LSQTIKVQHGCGCISGCGTLLVLWFVISGGTAALAWAQKNDGTVLAVMATLILGFALWYFTIGKKVIARSNAQRVEAAAAKAAASAPVLMAQPLAAPSLKRCPMCAESVQAEARICRYCRHDFGAPVG
jgi:hypothetical protein